MDKTLRRLVLPTTLVVTTIVSASSCNHYETYCADIESESKCNSEPGCSWSADYDECVNSCAEIVDQSECESIERCEWSVPIDEGETGGGGGPSCHEPFT